MSKEIDLTGKRFGRLVVLKKTGKLICGRSVYFCKCGVCERFVKVMRHNVKRIGNEKCRCYKKNVSARKVNASVEHPSRLYFKWENMHQRCEDKGHIHYELYGGNNPPITVCEEWKEFASFRLWSFQNGYMSNTNYCLSRLDDSKGYSPTNCEFISKEKNASKIMERSEVNKMEKKLFGEIEKDSTQKIKISLKEFKEMEFIDIRVFFSPTDGARDDFIPTKRGITLRVEQLKEFEKIISLVVQELA